MCVITIKTKINPIPNFNPLHTRYLPETTPNRNIIGT